MSDGRTGSAIHRCHSDADKGIKIVCSFDICQEAFVRKAAAASQCLYVNHPSGGQRRATIMLTLQVAEMTGAKIDELKALIQEHK